MFPVESGGLFDRTLQDYGSATIRITMKDGAYVASVTTGNEHYPAALGVSCVDAFGAINMALGEVARQRQLWEACQE